MKLKIFYSWQTTTDPKYNRYFILDCIKKTVKELKKKPDFAKIEFIIQEGINEEPGSPQVASKIVDERIPNCDIFIADLSVVNHISRSKRIVRNIIGDSYKPFQNNNVFYEYGVARQAVGEQKIIGILNASYGSPNENPDNIPFDLRHIRFPIQYKYSSRQKDKQSAKNELISGLTSAFKETAIYALQHQKDRYKPLVVWSEWAQMSTSSQKYHTSNFINEVSRQIIEGVENSNVSIRLIGLSGLGKTRILLETFRRDESVESVYLNSRVLYLNYNHYPNVDYQNLLAKIKEEKEDRIVILDNCPNSLHRQLLHFVQNESSRLSLITVDSNPEELEQGRINGVNYISIKQEDLAPIVDQILIEDIGVLGEEIIEKIKEFSQGIPLMAVLISEGVKNGEKFIGKLDDKELLDKLLGEKGKDKRYRTILKSCSIFNYFGFEDDLRTQLEFIATEKNITSISGEDQVIINDFYETCAHFLKREIFEKKGRLIGLRPFPLAMSLAQEWLEPCTPERLLDVIGSIAKLEDPDRKNLSEAIAERMKYLGYNEKASTIVDKIVGPHSPFDNAEVLNTELGSRLFRSFVEVNPIAVSENLSRVFANKTKNELLEIREGRRNLIWVLEKLCFDERTFNHGAKILYDFAIAENETWSNNATGQFLQLFKVILSGTEADLNERWEIIKWGINKGGKEYNSLAIKAMKSGLAFGNFTRMGGAENQGTKRLKDYQPSLVEISEYWNNILERLTLIVKTDLINNEEASEAIAKRIRPVFKARLGLIIMPFVEEISDYKNYDWDEALIELKHIKNHDKVSINNGLSERIDKLISLLTKTDFISRYKSIASSYHLDNDDSYSSDNVINALINLADEFIHDQLAWEDHLFTIFYSNPQIFSYHFGKRIYELIADDFDKIDEFIRISLNAIISINIELRNVTVLGGFISEADPQVKNEFYKTISTDNELSNLLFYFLSIDADGKKNFGLLFELIDSGVCKITDFNVFKNSNSLNNCGLIELEEFSSKLFDYGDEGHIQVFNIFFNLGYNKDELKNDLKPIFKKCILKLGVYKNEKDGFDNYKWAQTICSILSSNDESEFAKFINLSIIESLSWGITYHLDHNVQRIYESLIKFHFQPIFKDLSSALLSKDEEYIRFYGLRHILGSHIGGIGKSIGILFDGDIETIFKWCNENQPLAPARLAELVPIYGENNNNYSKWHPIAKRLIDEYGDIDEVLRGLITNIGSFSWTGSVVPLLKAQQVLFDSVKRHKIPQVAAWASNYLVYLDEQIKKEKNRDEEMYL